MRKKFMFSLILAVCVVVLSFVNINTNSSVSSPVENTETQVITVAKSNAKQDTALEKRFLNMLNHNFVYNDDFYDDYTLVNNSVLALLNVSEDSFVNRVYLDDYIFNMYGKKYSDYSFLETSSEQPENYVYILPRGYSVYTHKLVSLTKNEDGSYTVVSDVEISFEDGTTSTQRATTLFLENKESSFGFNILYSDINEILSNSVDC